MYRNIFKLMSALFVGLCLVTSCGGDDEKGGSGSSSGNSKVTLAINEAMLGASEACVEINGIDTSATATNDADKVQKAAEKIFKDKKVADKIEEAAKALGEDESKIKKKDLEDVKDLVTKYAVSGSNAGAEKTAACDLATKVVKKLSDLIGKLNKE